MDGGDKDRMGRGPETGADGVAADSAALPFASDPRGWWRRHFPGLAIAIVIALAASFLSEHYGAPAMLLAILIGLALHFMAEDPRNIPGLDFAARMLLRLGVALLGLRVSLGMFADLGWPMLAALAGAVVATILFGLVAARIGGQDSRFGLLSGGAVAICGASAAMALAAILSRPNRAEADRQMVFVVIGVTMLSTLAMIFYPILGAALGLDDRLIGLFLGATIHDVAQVAGAGFSVSVPAGETAVFVKLIRVTMLAPVVVVIALLWRRSMPRSLDEALPSGAARPPILPGFVLAFLAFGLINSAIALPTVISDAAGAVSRWSLLAAIAAVGVRTSLPDMLGVGGRAIAILVAETAFLALVILLAIRFLGPA